MYILQINLPIHTHIFLFDIFMKCFSFFCFNKSIVKYLFKVVENQPHFSHFVLNPLECDT